MRKVICSLAAGGHIPLLELSRGTYENYALRHGYDVVVEAIPQPAEENRRPVGGVIKASLVETYNRFGIGLIRWGIDHMPLSARLHVAGPPQSYWTRILDGLGNYGLRILAASVRTEEPPSWRKIRLIRSLLDQYDLVIWIDADAMIVDPTVDIATLLRPNKWLYGVVHEVDDGAHLNCGVLMIRSCGEAKAMLNDVARLRQYIHHPWWEQAAVLYLLGYDVRSITRIRDTKYTGGFAPISKQWNSIPPDAAERPYIEHYAGVANTRRLELMREHAAAFKRDTPATQPGRMPSGEES